MDVETASKLTFVKHNLMLEHPDLFKKRKREIESDEPEEEIIEEANVVEEMYEFDYLFDDD